MTFADGTYFETIFYFYYNSQMATNRRAWRWTAGVGGQPTDTTRVDDAFLNVTLEGIYGSLMVNAAELVGIRYTPLPNSGSVAPVYSNTVTSAGSGGAVALPKQSAALVRLKSTFLGKRGEGRVYIPFPPAAGNELTGVPTVAYISALSDLAAVFGVAQVCNSTTGVPGTIAPVLIPGPGGALTPIPVTSATPGHSWATQRRRGDYGRVNKNPFA